MRQMNRIAAVVVLLMAGVALGWLIPVHVPNAHDPGDLPPILVPTLSAAVMGLMALLLGVRSWRTKGTGHDEQEDGEAAEDLGFGAEELVNLCLWIAASAATWLLLRYLGFIYAAGFIIAAGAIYSGVRKPWVVIVLAVAAPLLIDNVVWYGLNVQLP